MAARHLCLVSSPGPGCATPVLLHLIRQFLSHASSPPVLFLCVRQTPALWAQFLRRAGVGVQALVQAQRLHIVDYLAVLGGVEGMPPGAAQGSRCDGAATNPQMSLLSLVSGLRDSSGHLVLVVDDVTVRGVCLASTPHLRPSGLGSLHSGALSKRFPHPPSLTSM